MTIKRGKSNEGFTFVEMVVVIAILAIIAAILVPTINRYTEEANKAKEQETLRTLYTKALLLNSQLPSSTSPNNRKITLDRSFLDNGVSGVSVVIDANGSVASIEYIGDSAVFNFNGRIMRELSK